MQVLLPWPKKLRQPRKPNIGACMLERLRACATCARLSTTAALAGACMLQRSACVLESGCQLCCTCTLATIASCSCCGRVTAQRASSCIMPSISDRSGIVKGRSPPERRGKPLFFTSKRNERETQHVLAPATRLHLPPEAMRNLVELVRSRRRFSGVENRPHLFQWRTREKVLGENKS